MKIKRIDPVRVFKKGKTRGRPSKMELRVSAILSHMFKKNEKEIQKSIDDLFAYGVSITRFKPWPPARGKRLRRWPEIYVQLFTTRLENADQGQDVFAEGSLRIFSPKSRRRGGRRF